MPQSNGNYYLDQTIEDNGVAQTEQWATSNPKREYNYGNTGLSAIRSGSSDIFRNQYLPKYTSDLFSSQHNITERDLNKLDINDVLNHPEDLEYILGDNQSGWSQLGNSIVNFGVITGTSFVQNTLGVANGFLQSILNWTDGEFNASDAGGFWDNTINNWMANLQESAMNSFPIHRTKKYEEASTLGRLGTMTFWADLVQNSGYTAGSVATSMAANAIGLGPIWSAMLGAYGESAIEAVNYKKDKINNTANIAIAEYEKKLAEATSEEEALALREELQNTLTQNEEDAILAGNFSFLSNLALLTATNAFEMRNLLGKGAAKKAAQEAASEFIEGGADAVRRSVTDGAQLSLRTVKDIALERAGGAVATGTSEGLQEVFQEGISNTADWNIHYNSFNESIFNPEARELADGLIASSMKAVTETLQDKETGTLFLTGFITGLFGAPSVRGMRNSDGSLRSPIYMTGDVWNVFGVKKEYEKQKKVVDEINSILENGTYAEAYKNLAQQMYFSEMQGRAEAAGDEFNAENWKLAGLNSLINLYDKFGMGEAFVERLEDIEFTDEEIYQDMVANQAIANSGTIDSLTEGSEGTAEGNIPENFRDSKKFKTHKENILSNLAIAKTYAKKMLRNNKLIRAALGEGVSDDVVSKLVYGATQIDIWDMHNDSKARVLTGEKVAENFTNIENLSPELSKMFGEAYDRLSKERQAKYAGKEDYIRRHLTAENLKNNREFRKVYREAIQSSNLFEFEKELLVEQLDYIDKSTESIAKFREKMDRDFKNPFEAEMKMQDTIKEVRRKEYDKIVQNKIKELKKLNPTELTKALDSLDFTLRESVLDKLEGTYPIGSNERTLVQNYRKKRIAVNVFSKQLQEIKTSAQDPNLGIYSKVDYDEFNKLVQSGEFTGMTDLSYEGILNFLDEVIKETNADTVKELKRNIEKAVEDVMKIAPSDIPGLNKPGNSTSDSSRTTSIFDSEGFEEEIDSDSTDESTDDSSTASPPTPKPTAAPPTDTPSNPVVTPTKPKSLDVDASTEAGNLAKEYIDSLLASDLERAKTEAEKVALLEAYLDDPKKHILGTIKFFHQDVSDEVLTDAVEIVLKYINRELLILKTPSILDNTTSERNEPVSTPEEAPKPTDGSNSSTDRTPIDSHRISLHSIVNGEDISNNPEEIPVIDTYKFLSKESEGLWKGLRDFLVEKGYYNLIKSGQLGAYFTAYPNTPIYYYRPSGNTNVYMLIEATDKAKKAMPIVKEYYTVGGKDYIVVGGTDARYKVHKNALAAVGLLNSNASGFGSKVSRCQKLNSGKMVTTKNDISLDTLLANEEDFKFGRDFGFAVKFSDGLEFFGVPGVAANKNSFTYLGDVVMYIRGADNKYYPRALTVRTAADLLSGILQNTPYGNILIQRIEALYDAKNKYETLAAITALRNSFVCQHLGYNKNLKSFNINSRKDNISKENCDKAQFVNLVLQALGDSQLNIKVSYLKDPSSLKLLVNSKVFATDLATLRNLNASFLYSFPGVIPESVSGISDASALNNPQAIAHNGITYTVRRDSMGNVYITDDKYNPIEFSESEQDLKELILLIYDVRMSPDKYTPKSYKTESSKKAPIINIITAGKFHLEVQENTYVGLVSEEDFKKYQEYSSTRNELPISTDSSASPILSDKNNNVFYHGMEDVTEEEAPATPIDLSRSGNTSRLLDKMEEISDDSSGENKPTTKPSVSKDSRNKAAPIIQEEESVNWSNEDSFTEGNETNGSIESMYDSAKMDLLNREEPFTSEEVDAAILKMKELSQNIPVSVQDIINQLEHILNCM